MLASIWILQLDATWENAYKFYVQFNMFLVGDNSLNGCSQVGSKQLKENKRRKL